jgi:hypothetical protein
VKCLSRGTSSCVQVKQLASFISVEDYIKVSVTEENASANEPVRLSASAFCYLCSHLFSHGEAAKLVEQLVIVNAFVTGSLNFESRNEIFNLFLLSLAFLFYFSFFYF